MKSEIEKHFDEIANKYDSYKSRNKYYYSNLKKFFIEQVRPRSKVLEVGCGTGDLLSTMNPKFGVGVDISEKMVELARKKHKDLKFVVSSIESLRLDGKFDFILMADLVEHLQDVYMALKSLRNNCKPDTKIIITSINPTWSMPLHVLEHLKMKMPEGPHNWIGLEDLGNILNLLDYRIVKRGHFLHSLVQYVIAQPAPSKKRRKLTVSVVIPAYNEVGNIANCVRRVGKVLSANDEIIVVDDGSTDRTSSAVKKVMKKDRRIKLVSYKPNVGKGNAVKVGFDAAKKDVIVILDADMSVPPEEIDRFVGPIEKGKADFVNGTRLIYPLEEGAMTDLHMFGNRIFGRTFTWLLGQRITDTLCGTKSLLRSDYLKNITLRTKAWPDFDMLFNAAKSKMRIVEMPVHYKKRISGKSKMKTFMHGMLLARMCLRGFWELKFKKSLGGK